MQLPHDKYWSSTQPPEVQLACFGEFFDGRDPGYRRDPIFSLKLTYDMLFAYGGHTTSNIANPDYS
jgi:hypothetical protein